MGENVAHEEEYQSEYHRLHCFDNVCPGLLRLGGGAVHEMEDPLKQKATERLTLLLVRHH
jgi:hypothetical protein